MKFAICIKGLHSIQVYLQSGLTESILTNCQNSFNNFNSFVVEKLTEKKYLTDLFISTYDCDLGNYLLSLYNPQYVNKFDIKVADGEHRFISQINHYLKLIQLIKESEKKNNFIYDQIIMLRFDMLFKKNINDMPVNYDKFNISIRHLSGNCDDNLWIFPRKYLDIFEESLLIMLNIDNSAYKTTHYINNVLTKFNVPIHYFYDMENHAGETYIYWSFNNGYTANC